MDDTETAKMRSPLVAATVVGLAAVAALVAVPALASVPVAILLVGLVGWPLAVSVGAVVRSRLNRLGLSVMFSLAISMLSFQTLYRFELVSPVAVVLLATAYGLTLGWLVPNARRTYGWRAGGAA